MAGYEINTNKSVTVLYKNDKAEKDIRKTIFFKIATNKIKYLGVTLPKQVRDFYDKNIF